MAKQIHGRLTDEQVQIILEKYVSNELGRVQAMDMLGLGRSQFFEWVKRYKDGCREFSIAYARETHNRVISRAMEERILHELKREKALIDDPAMPVRFHNYSFIRDQIIKECHEEVSLPTIIDRAKKTAFISQNQGRSTMTGR